jgi:hypothetical protein
MSVMHYKDAPQRQTINKHFYLQAVRCLSDAVQHKRPQEWEADDRQIHHDWMHLPTQPSLCGSF